MYKPDKYEKHGGSYKAGSTMYAYYSCGCAWSKDTPQKVIG